MMEEATIATSSFTQHVGLSHDSDRHLQNNKNRSRPVRYLPTLNLQMHSQSFYSDHGEGCIF